MKKTILALSSAVALSLFAVGCNPKKENPETKQSVQEVKLTDLTVSSQFILTPYTQKYTLNEGDSYYSLSENKATFSLNIVTNFNGEIVSDKATVNTMPNTEKGEYARIAITSDSTIQHQYKSFIQGRALTTDKTLPITFKTGNFEDYKAGKRCVVVHTDAAIDSLREEYSWQMVLEMTPRAMQMINDYGYEKITHKGSEPENVKKFTLKDNYKVTKKEIPSPELTFEGGKCFYKNDGVTEYEIDFTGSFLPKE